MGRRSGHFRKPPKPPSSGRWRIIALTLLGLFLLYHVVTKSFGAYLADADPEAALVLNGNNPTALLNLAEDKLSKDDELHAS